MIGKLTRRNLRTFFSSLKAQPQTKSFAEIKDLLVAGNKIFYDNPTYAIQKYEEALALDEDCHQAYVRRAYGYLQIKELNQALEDAQASVKLAPLDTEAHVCMGIIQTAREEYAQALDSLYKAIDLSCPLDPRLTMIHQKVKTTQQVMRGGSPPTQPSESLSPPQNFSPVQTPPAQPPLTQPNLSEDDNLPPFSNPDFVKQQQEISTKMYNLGDDKFRQRMMDLANIPALKEFQEKVMRGEQPTHHDYYKLSQEPKFQVFAQKLAQMQQHSDLQEFSELAKVGDWNNAFNILSNDPKAMSAYMQFLGDEE